jgi:hypothetical protein
MKGHTLGSIVADLGFSTQTGLKNCLSSRWWIGEKARLKTEARTWDESAQRYRRRKSAHRNPIIVKTNLALRPLVPVETWEAVQSVFHRNHEKWRMKIIRANEHLGGGLLFCGCGARMYYNKQSRPGKNPNYICSLKYRGKGHREAQNFNATELDNQIALQAVLNLGNEKFIQSKINVLTKQECEEKERTVQRAEGALLGLQRRMEDLWEAIEEYGFTPKHRRSVKELEREIAESKSDLLTARDELRAVIRESDVKMIANTVRREFASFMQMDRLHQKELLARYVERIAVTEDKSTTIVLNFRVKVGVFESLYQRDSTPLERPSKTKRKPAGSDKRSRVALAL